MATTPIQLNFSVSKASGTAILNQIRSIRDSINTSDAVQLSYRLDPASLSKITSDIKTLQAQMDAALAGSGKNAGIVRSEAYQREYAEMQRALTMTQKYAAGLHVLDAEKKKLSQSYRAVNGAYDVKGIEALNNQMDVTRGRIQEVRSDYEKLSTAVRELRQLEMNAAKLNTTEGMAAARQEAERLREVITETGSRLQMTEGQIAEFTRRTASEEMNVAEAYGTRAKAADAMVARTTEQLNALTLEGDKLAEVTAARERYEAAQVAYQANPTDMERIVALQETAILYADIASGAIEAGVQGQQAAQMTAVEITKLNNLYLQMDTYQKQYGESLKRNAQLTGQLQTLMLKVQQQKITPADAVKEFSAIRVQARGLGLEVQTLGQKMQAIFGSGMIQRVRMVFSMAAFTLVRQLLQNVKDIDAAMVELRKVTDETARTYDKFMDYAARRTQDLGATMSDVIKSTADFARLGYSLDEAAKLADAAIVFKNVGDGISDIDDASEKIISMVKAFSDYEGHAMDIVDKMNEVGNHFEISSSGIGEALQRSAGALSAAGNTLDESIALAVGMNSITQNPERVGTALKTLTMYLRASKTEAEEAGESTEGMAESVSKLREELLTLTRGKVDIQIDRNTYKSTIQILRELASVWDTLPDLDQANILERIGGKRNSSVIVSVLKNFDSVEKALRTSMSAEGSALKENEKYLDSVPGKLDKLKASWESLSRNLVTSDAAKSVLTLVNAILRGTDAVVGFIGPFGTLVALIGSLVAVRKFDDLKNLGRITTAFSDIGQAKTALAGMDATLVASTAALHGYNAEQIAATMNAAGFSAAQTAQALASAGAGEAVVADALAMAGYSPEAIQAALATTVFSTAEGAGTAASLGFAASLKAVAAGFKAMMASNPLLWIAAAGAAIALAVKFVKWLNEAQDRAIEKAKESREAYESTQSEVDGLITRLQELDQQIAEIHNRGKLSITDNEELKLLQSERAELEQQYELKQKLAAYEGAQAAADTEEALNTPKRYSVVDIAPFPTSVEEEGEDYRRDNTYEKAEYLLDTLNHLQELKTASENKLARALSGELQGLSDYEMTQIEQAPMQWEQRIMTAKTALGQTMQELSDARASFVDAAGNVFVGHEAAVSRIDGLIERFIELDKATVEQSEALTSMPVAMSKQVRAAYTAYTKNNNKKRSDKALSNEMQKLQDFGLYGFVTDKLQGALDFDPNTSGFIQHQFGNVDMDKRVIINWSNELKETYKTELESWDYNPEVGSIDTVFGGSSRYGEGDGVEIAFTPILNDDGEAKFLSQQTVDTYLNELVADATKDGVVNHDLLLQMDREGRQVGDTYVHGIVAAIDESTEYANNGNWADTVGRLMHFSGNFGAINLAATSTAETGENAYYQDFQQKLQRDNQLASFTINQEQNTEQLEALSAAFKSSTDAAGVNDETMGKVIARYQELASFDVNTLFVNTANGFRINTDEALRLEAELSAMQQTGIDERMRVWTERLDDVNGQLKNSSKLSNDEVQALLSARSEIVQRIRDTEDMATAYAALTSNYKQWVDAQDNGEEGDMYDSIVQGYSSAKELFDKGLTGTNEFREYVELISGKDLSTEPIKAVVDEWKRINTVNKETGFAPLDYLSEGSAGVENFIFAVQKMHKDWVSFNKDTGSWELNIDSVDQLAQALQVDSEFVESILAKASDYGVDVNITTTEVEGGFATAAEAADALGSKLNGLELDFETDDLEVATNQLIGFTQYYSTLLDKDGKIKLDTEEAQAAYTVMTALWEQWFNLSHNNSFIYNIDYSSIDDSSSKADQFYGALGRLVEAQANVEKAFATGTGIEDAQNELNTAIAGFTEAYDALDTKTQKKLSLDFDVSTLNAQNVTELISQISQKEPKVMVDIGVSQRLVQTDIVEEDANNVDVVVSIVQNKVKEWIDDPSDKNVDVTVSPLLKSFTDWLAEIPTKYVQVQELPDANGPGGFQGTAHAGGSWKLPHAETALVGELGTELYVNPRTGRWQTIGEHGAEFTHLPRGAIVFNHKQTEQLFKYGRISSRGRALASGNAYAGRSDDDKTFTGFTNLSTDARGKTVTGKNPLATYAKQSASTVAKTGQQVADTTKDVADSVLDDTAEMSEATKTALEKFQDETSKFYDWAEITLANIEKKTDAYLSKAEKQVDAGNYRGAAKQYGKAQSSLAKQIRLQDNAESMYMAQANKVLQSAISKGLVSSQKADVIANRVANGKMNISSLGEATQEVVTAYKEYYDKAMDAAEATAELRDKYEELNTTIANLPLDNAEAKIDKLGKIEDVLNARYEVTDSARDQNKILSRLDRSAEKQAQARENAATEAKRNTNKSWRNRYVQAAAEAQGRSKGQKLSTKGLDPDSKEYRAIAQYNANLVAQAEAERLAKIERDQATKTKRDNAKARFDNRMHEQERKRAARDNAIAEAQSAVDNIDLALRKSADAGEVKSYAEELAKAEQTLGARLKDDVTGTAAELRKAEAWYNKYKDDMSADDRLAAEEEIAELREQAIQAEVTYYAYLDEQQARAIENAETLISLYSSIETLKNTEIDIKKSTGQRVTAEDYLGTYDENGNLIDEGLLQISQNKQQEYQNEKDLVDAQIAEKLAQGYAETDQAVAELIIKSNTLANSIKTEEQNQIAYNKAAEQIPLDDIEYELYLRDQNRRTMENEIALKEELGQVVGVNDYLALIQNEDERIKKLEYQKQLLLEQQQGLEENSEEYRRIQKEIDQCDESILDAKRDQISWNEKVNELSYADLERELKALQHESENISAMYGDGLFGGIGYVKQIINGYKQLNVLRTQYQQAAAELSNYEVGSTKYNETQDRMYSIQSSMHDINRQQQNWNQKLQEMPVNALNAFFDIAKSIMNMLDGIVDLRKAVMRTTSELDYFVKIGARIGTIAIDVAKIGADAVFAGLSLMPGITMDTGTGSIGYALDLSQIGQFAGRTLTEWLQDGVNSMEDIIDKATEIANLVTEYRDVILWKSLDQAHTRINALKETLTGVSNLITDDMVRDSEGKMTDYGIAKLGALTTQYKMAQAEVEQYKDEINQLNRLYSFGWYNSEEYEAKLHELQHGLLSAQADMQGFENSLLDLVRESAEAELDALNKIIDARQDALQAKKDYYDYDKKIRSKTKDIQALQAQIAALEGMQDAEAKAKRAQLQAELAEAQEELNDTVHEHLVELSQDALDGLRTALEDAFKDEWDNIHTDLTKVTAKLQEIQDNLDMDLVNATMRGLMEHYGIEFRENQNGELRDNSMFLGVTSGLVDKVIANATLSEAEIVEKALQNLVKLERATVSTLEDGTRVYRDAVAKDSNGMPKLLAQIAADGTILGGGEVDRDDLKEVKDSKVYNELIDFNLAFRNYVSSTNGKKTADELLFETLRDMANGDWVTKAILNAQDKIVAKASGQDAEDSYADIAELKMDQKLGTTILGQIYDKFSDYADSHQNIFGSIAGWIGDKINTSRVEIDNQSVISDTTKDIRNWWDRLIQSIRDGWSNFTTGVSNFFGGIGKHAKGSKRIPKNELAWTQEGGKEEWIVRKSDGAILTPLSKGDGVLPADLTAKLYALAQGQMQMPTVNLPDFSVTENFSPVYNIDCSINVEGSVDAAVVSDLKKLRDDMKEDMYQYMTDRMHRGAVHSGGKRRL